MADDFFEENKEVVTQEAPVEKVKVGEEEFTQEELQKLVGLGKIGLESESKFKTKIESVWPKYQQVINEKRELETKYKELEEKSKEPAKPAESSQLTAEQIKAEALKQAEELGIGPQAIRKVVFDVVQGQKLLDDISNVIDTMTADGLPSTTTEDVIAHMQETGIRNPEKAYKDMFEKEWTESQATKLAQLKTKGLSTVEQSQAGSKQPTPVQFRGMAEDKLTAAVSEALSNSFQ